MSPERVSCNLTGKQSIISLSTHEASDVDTSLREKYIYLWLIDVISDNTIYSTVPLLHFRYETNAPVYIHTGSTILKEILLLLLTYVFYLLVTPGYPRTQFVDWSDLIEICPSLSLECWD